MAKEISDRLSSIFLRDADGHRPVYGGTERFQDDPHWRDLILFYEYFHGDNGAGLGASHQTGWTGVVARIMQMFATTTPEKLLARGNMHVASAPPRSPAPRTEAAPPAGAAVDRPAEPPPGGPRTDRKAGATHVGRD